MAARIAPHVMDPPAEFPSTEPKHGCQIIRDFFYQAHLNGNEVLFNNGTFWFNKRVKEVRCGVRDNEQLELEIETWIGARTVGRIGNFINSYASVQRPTRDHLRVSVNRFESKEEKYERDSEGDLHYTGMQFEYYPEIFEFRQYHPVKDFFWKFWNVK